MRDKTQNGSSLEDGSHGDTIDRIVKDPMRIVADESQKVGGGTDATTDSGNAWGFDALSVARSTYSDSVSFMDSSLRTRWEASTRQFNNRHPSGSKYNSENYKAKSRLFRPKTRAAMRQAEAQAAASFFANEDVAKVSPADPDDLMQAAGAAVLHETLKYRLTTPVPRVAIPWFATLVGAFQNTKKDGIVISKQWWEYRAIEWDVKTEVLDEATGVQKLDESGRPMFTSKVDKKVIVDRPRCDILPPETVLIDRGALWTDPIGTSPYVILMIPMYIGDVLARMNRPDGKTGQPAWKKVDIATLKTAAKEQAFDSTRQEREGKREDSKDSQISIDEMQIIWVHENFVRWDDEEFVYYTVGTDHLLTDPMPVEEVYPHCYPGERPLVMGQCIIETNKLYPASMPELVAGLQGEANEIVNQRLDNVKLALNKRYLVKRGSQTDLRSLLRNTSGSVTLTADPDADVKVVETRDVTASSYQEQDRVNADFDEIAGAFSVGSVNTNRRLGETVGGMSLISGAANSLGELDLRVFTETWAQPTLSQILRLIQHFETDATILARCGRKAELWQQYRVATINDQLLMQDVVVQVDVGIGATDPMQRLQKFQVGAKTLKEIFGEALAPNLEAEEITKEVMSMIGYRDGRRFFNFKETSPIVTQLQGQLQELQGKVETKELERQSRVQVAQIGAAAKIIAQGMDSDQRMQESMMTGQGDLEAKRAEMEMDAQAQAQEMLFDQRRHAMDMQHEQEKHGMDMRMKALDAFTQAALGQQQVQQNAALGQQRIDQSQQAGQQKIDHTRQMGDLKIEQQRASAAAAAAGGAGGGGKKPAGAARAAPPVPASPSAPPAPAPQESPAMDEMARGMVMLAEALQQQAQAMQQMVATMAAPKRVIFGPDGRPAGIEPVV